MRIENRGDEEWLVDVDVDMNDCPEMSPCGQFLCTRHFNGEHIAGGAHASDGSISVEARWPIDSAPAQPAQSAPRILTPADANQPRDIASAGHATTCGTCLTALTEEPHRPGCPEPGYIAERERVSALVRAARRWAAVASDTGRPAEEMIAADLELAEAVDALDGAASAQRPRDLAGRIRALVQEYAGRWADETDAGTADAYEEVVRTLRACLTSVRVGFPGSVQAAADALRAEAAIPGRYSRSNASAVAPLTQAADDLERIVRECGEPKR